MTKKIKLKEREIMPICNKTFTKNFKKCPEGIHYTKQRSWENSRKHYYNQSWHLSFPNSSKCELRVKVNYLQLVIFLEHYLKQQIYIQIKNNNNNKASVAFPVNGRKIKVI